MARRSSSEKLASKKRRKGPSAQDALLSLALPSSSAERPSTSRRLTSLPSVAPTIRPSEATTSTASGSGLFQAEDGCSPASAPVPTAAMGLGLGEDLGIGPDADLEVLGPGAARDQRRLEPHGLVGAGAQLREILAHQGHDLGPDAGRGGVVAPRTLLDDAFEHRHREGDARRLHGLEVDGGEQPGPAGVAALRHGVGQHLVEPADPLAGGGAERFGGVGRLGEVAHRREARRDVVEPVRPHPPPPRGRRRPAATRGPRGPRLFRPAAGLRRCRG